MTQQKYCSKCGKKLPENLFATLQKELGKESNVYAGISIHMAHVILEKIKCSD